MRISSLFLQEPALRLYRGTEEDGTSIVCFLLYFLLERRFTTLLSVVICKSKDETICVRRNDHNQLSSRKTKQGFNCCGTSTDYN